MPLLVPVRVGAEGPAHLNIRLGSSFSFTPLQLSLQLSPTLSHSLARTLTRSHAPTSKLSISSPAAYALRLTVDSDSTHT